MPLLWARSALQRKHGKIHPSGFFHAPSPSRGSRGTRQTPRTFRLQPAFEIPPLRLRILGHVQPELFLAPILKPDFVGHEPHIGSEAVGGLPQGENFQAGPLGFFPSFWSLELKISFCREPYGWQVNPTLLLRG